MTAFDQHVASVQNLDESLYLGRLVWYSVSGMCVAHGHVVAALHQSGVSAQLPPIPKDFDVFRRVSTRAGMKKVPRDDGTFENYLIREVTGVGENIINRRIVIETVDRQGKRLDYRQSTDIMFYKDTGLIAFQDNFEDADNPNVLEICKNIQDEYTYWTGMLDNYAIREFIRKLLLSWGAIPVRDGVYFLPEEQAKNGNVEGIEIMVNSLPGDSFLHSMPLVDDAKQRDMIRQAFEADTNGAIDTLMGKITEITKSGKKISGDRFAGILTEYQNLIASTKEYETVLESTLENTQTRLMLFQAQVLGLQKYVKV